MHNANWIYSKHAIQSFHFPIVVAPVTWFDDSFKFLLVPFGYATGEPKPFTKWNGKDFCASLVPDIGQDSHWLEYCVDLILTVQLCEFSSNKIRSFMFILQ